MARELEWKDEYSVYVKEIDDQHKQLVKLIFKLFTAINEQKTKEELGGVLGELAKYAGFHFSTEEKYFDAFDYEHKDEHVAEHRKFAEKVTDLQTKYANNEVEISFELIDFLEDWLLNHLMEMDQRYVKCFTKNGLK
jgi:hemerythrin